MVQETLLGQRNVEDVEAKIYDGNEEKNLSKLVIIQLALFNLTLKTRVSLAKIETTKLFIITMIELFALIYQQDYGRVV